MTKRTSSWCGDSHQQQRQKLKGLNQPARKDVFSAWLVEVPSADPLDQGSKLCCGTQGHQTTTHSRRA
ncbi:hypothetical protein NPIL_457941, partial [Nephila pilipes]